MFGAHLSDDAIMGAALAEAGCTATLRAESPDWQTLALFELRAFAATHAAFTCEQFRVKWLTDGNPPAHSHHVWGALFRLAERDGIIRATGNYKRAASPATRAHPVMIWRAAA